MRAARSFMRSAVRLALRLFQSIRCVGLHFSEYLVDVTLFPVLAPVNIWLACRIGSRRVYGPLSPSRFALRRFNVERSQDRSPRKTFSKGERWTASATRSSATRSPRASFIHLGAVRGRHPIIII